MVIPIGTVLQALLSHTIVYSVESNVFLVSEYRCFLASSKNTRPSKCVLQVGTLPTLYKPADFPHKKLVWRVFWGFRFPKFPYLPLVFFFMLGWPGFAGVLCNVLQRSQPGDTRQM